MKPTIACFKNGPYVVKNLSEFRNSNDTPIECKPVMALCRCGSSKKKPFCDGEHKKVGFSDANTADKTMDKVTSYAGNQITVHDNRSVCAHVGYCTDQLANCFRHKENPWIHPNAESSEKIINTIKQCPSGALSYSMNEEKHTMIPSQPGIKIIKDGPLAITGGIELVDQPFSQGVPTSHYTLCRCGESKNKPFCDGSHWHVGYKG